ncbi:hypothetical protein OF376_00100 [Ureaplasma miroungigenitalium]|uniref:Septation ring formation regulator EzrA n=1 Tax=Ureaplasma miroungigenitalium TaxID=1042321 RepID=A0ABT3BLQ9_9BACT|nr:hypothetical protein [Ureaplasma miroungigenitalium]MCV3728191.1 hypothetical protein [Ureaplasma miroungigenitalium]
MPLYWVIGFLAFCLLTGLCAIISMLWMHINYRKQYHRYLQTLIINRQKFDDRFYKVFLAESNIFKDAKPHSSAIINEYRFSINDQISLLNDQLIIFAQLITKGYIFKAFKYSRQLKQQFQLLADNIQTFDNALYQFWASFDENDDRIVNHYITNKKIDQIYNEFSHKYNLNNDHYLKAANNLRGLIADLETYKQKHEKQKEAKINKLIISTIKNKFHLLKNLIYLISTISHLCTRHNDLMKYLLSSYKSDQLDAYFMLNNEWNVFCRQQFYEYVKTSKFQLIFSEYLCRLETFLDTLIPQVYEYYKTQEIYQAFSEQITNLLPIIHQHLLVIEKEMREAHILWQTIDYPRVFNQLETMMINVQRLNTQYTTVQWIPEYSALMNIYHFINDFNLLQNAWKQWNEQIQQLNQQMQTIYHKVHENLFYVQQIYALKNQQIVLLKDDYEFLVKIQKDLAAKNYSFLDDAVYIISYLKIISERLEFTKMYANLIMHQIPIWANACQNFFDDHNLTYTAINNHSVKEQLDLIQTHLEQINQYRNKK